MTFQRTMKVIAAINDDEYLQKITNNIASFEDIRMIASSKHATDIMELCERLSPDILISDLSLEHGKMNNVIQKICANATNKVKVITTASSKEGEAYMSQSIQNISPRLYLKIAEEYDTNQRHIERAIFRAVTHMNNACGKEHILRTILGYEVDASNYTLSAKELIALISDQLRIQYLYE